MLPAVPEPLAVPGTDGAIVLVTLQIDQTTCQEVYSIRLASDIERLTVMIGQDRLADGLKELARPLGRVIYRVGSAKILNGSDQAVQAEWARQGNGAVAGVASIFLDTTPPATIDVMAKQSVVLGQALNAGNPIPGSSLVPSKFALPSTCPAITLAWPVPLQ